MLTNLDKFNNFIKDRQRFSNDTFGSPEVRDCIAPLTHLQDEIVELKENPNDEMEWADCMLLLLDAAWRKGHTVDDLLEFSIKKLEINKKRTWEKKPNGVYKHINKDENAKQ